MKFSKGIVAGIITMFVLIAAFCMPLQTQAANLNTSSIVQASTFTDIDEHWARSYIQFLAERGIVKGKYIPFRPNAPISRGEAIALLNRVTQYSYGVVASPAEAAKVDKRYPLVQEIKQAVGTMNVMLYADQKAYTRFNPGDNALYLLHLSAVKKPLKIGRILESDWWLSSEHLQAPLNREEASMLLFHTILPNIRYDLHIEPAKLQEGLNGYYQATVSNAYQDTQSLYATGIKGYKLLEDHSGLFQPTQIMTRAQFAVILQRLLIANEQQKQKQWSGPVQEKTRISNLMLTAATYAYLSKNEQLMTSYFSKDALHTIEKLRPLPLHDIMGSYQVIDSNDNTIKAQGAYFSSMTGNYKVEYEMIKSEQSSNPYGWVITKITHIQK
ncbi:S-layer homology domain-containing protein [Brevibacillus laterosporus]|uniref:S-layer homology domain-containing protein n=1 Tax=Brevibacillus laterosporus TaxID=1465 RepID=A0AAP8U379_BRELA|nr:S-layer homology domain-containing protein [Brevibacillus laterosporus]MCR8983194.1 S-layer homology domain-containing protein [Brevibacillus laterosporus]MCZ0810350.1 S-layer homology domain-containing protein [Brevibacillus laterosporus]MCZ0828972.1 S-layer homology domain-containing protein [Brevibacillus laterosporus]MCZ0853038.1 S-layer homology domain-containing protein [Brevibacillus laterosporus]MED1664197.1 S-layer homology domain-containing protein [Brevibacillus laterosporus]